MKTHEKLLFANFILVSARNQGKSLEWCREHISGNIWNLAVSANLNGIFGKPYYGIA